MKKLLGILVLGLLWCGAVTSAEVVLYCALKKVEPLGEMLTEADKKMVQNWAM